MLLPEALLVAMESLVSSVDRKKLQKSADDLSYRYRNVSSKEEPLIKTQEECLAYLCTRFPATFAANHYVLSEIIRRNLDIPIHSVLDLGAGSGAALWAASSVLEGIASYTLLERDPRLIDIGKRLLEHATLPFVPKWISADYTNNLAESSYDLTLFSYSLGELESKKWDSVLQQVSERTKQLLVIVEPGTPVGYKNIMKMREKLLQLGLYTVAPCPHNKPCPMLQPDWCHFSQRLPRTSLHRTLKSASLGFEDEKFSYIIMSKIPYAFKGYRVIKSPVKRSGYVELELCSTEEGLLHKKTSKKEKDFFSMAKKLDWGSFYSDK